MKADIAALLYLLSGVLFILALKGLASPATSRAGNRTWFFVADLPEGQRTRDVSTESDQVTWLPALRAVSDVEEEQIFMLPPTSCSIDEVGPCSDLEASVAE